MERGVFISVVLLPAQIKLEEPVTDVFGVGEGFEALAHFALDDIWASEGEALKEGGVGKFGGEVGEGRRGTASTMRAERHDRLASQVVLR